MPGTWVEPPAEGLLWTPGYWGWVNHGYRWHPGYWGTTVGFYGGIDYGYGYSGVGYEGGYWNDGAFDDNRSANNIDAAIVRNTYVRTVSSPGAEATLVTMVEPAEQVLDRQPHKKRRHMDVIVRQRRHKQNIDKPPAETTNSWRR